MGIMSAPAATKSWESKMAQSKKNFKDYLIWFLKSGLYVMPILLGLDILTKLLCVTNLYSFSSGSATRIITVIPNFFYIDVTTNKGAAWSSFSNQTVLLSLISLFASIAMIVFLALKYKKMNGWVKAAMYLMIPGAIGNLIDRSFSYLAPNSLYRNGVIDFLSFHFGSYVFPTFNLADSYLCISVLVLIIGVIIMDYSSAHKHAYLQKKGQEEIADKEGKIEESKDDGRQEKDEKAADEEKKE